MTQDYIEHHKKMNSTQNRLQGYLGAKPYYDAELSQILQYVNKNLPIVEIGSGFGYLAKYLTEYNAYGGGFKDISCVDTSKGLLEEIKSWINPCPNLYNEDGLEFLKKHKNKYGLIIMYDVFEHFPLEKAVELAKACYDALNEEGMLVIRTPNMANILGIYSKYIDVTHYYCYTQYSLTQILNEAGFKDNAINVWEPKWKIGSMHYKNKIKNDEIHKKLFVLHDRVQPSTFDKNLLMSASKTPKKIISIDLSQPKFKLFGKTKIADKRIIHFFGIKFSYKKSNKH